MANDLFSDLSQVLPHLAGIEAKIRTLQSISKHLEESQIEILVVLPDGDTSIVINQDIVPFNMRMEVRTLIDDSIDEFQRQLVNLKELSNGDSIA